MYLLLITVHFEKKNSHKFMEKILFSQKTAHFLAKSIPISDNSFYEALMSFHEKWNSFSLSMVKTLPENIIFSVAKSLLYSVINE